MDSRLLTAQVAELCLARTRTYLNGQPRTGEKDQFFFYVLDVLHNVPVWLADPSTDAHAMLLRHISYAPAEVQAWFQEALNFIAAPTA